MHLIKLTDIKSRTWAIKWNDVHIKSIDINVFFVFFTPSFFFSFVDFYRSRRLNQDFCSQHFANAEEIASINERRNESFPASARLLKVEVKMFFSIANEKHRHTNFARLRWIFLIFIGVYWQRLSTCSIAAEKNVFIGVLIIITAYWLVFFSL